MKPIIVILFIFSNYYNSYAQESIVNFEPTYTDSIIGIYEIKADLNIRSSKFYEAANNYSEIIKKYPTSTKYIFKRGMMYLAGKYYDKAKEDFDVLVTLNAENLPEVYFYRGLCKILTENVSINPDGCTDIAKSREMGFKADLSGFQNICKNL